MSINSKIKGFLIMNNETVSSYAEFTNRSQANISNKISRTSWNVQDFIHLAQLTNTKLAFIDENNNPVIIFNETDLLEEPKK